MFNLSKHEAFRAQEQFCLIDQSTTMATLLDGTNCKRLERDSGATKSFISKQYCLKNKYLHGFPEFSSKAKVIQVGK